MIRQQLSEKLNQTISKIDAINQTDPHQKEYPYSLALTNWVLRLQPNASEALQIAARGQHIARWQTPRDSYPMDRGGYLRWREDLKKFHSQKVSAIMTEVGYDPELIEKTRSIILKKNFKEENDAQTLEDALCLVFLETQFDELIAKTPEDKMITILQKTWKKMSDQGHKEALKLSYSEAAKALLQKALI